MKNYLEFERDIKVLEEELEKLKDPFNREGLSEIDTDKISTIQSEIDLKLKSSYANLNEWQKTQVARHEERPKAKFFIENLFTNFVNLSGDRKFAEDESVITGFALFESKSVLVIGQEKGDDLDSRLKRNFGMMRPEGYRKCIRLMKLANKFNIPQDLLKRQVEITGPPVPKKMLISALNSGADCYMTDFEDSLTPTFDNLMQGQLNIKNAINKTIDFTEPESGKEYKLNEKTAVLIIRPRGLHLDEKNVTVNNERISGTFFDLGLSLFHNAKKLVENGSGPYFYLPKLSSTDLTCCGICHQIVYHATP